jgi:hypothetical protein
MASGLELITPLYVYLNHQSSRNFLGLLEFLAASNKKLTAEETKSIKATLGLSIEIDHSSYLTFDEELWGVLGKFNLSVDWWKYLPEEGGEKPVKSASPEAITLAEKVATSLAEINQARGIGQEGASLSYFHEVNSLLKSSKEFQRLKEYSDEISAYINECTVGPAKSTGIKIRVNIPDDLWDWLFGSICQISSEFLIKNNDEFLESDKGHDSPKYKAVELCAYYSLIYLALISIHRISSYKAFVLPVTTVVEKIIFTSNPLIKAAISFNIDEEKNDRPLQRPFIEIWSLIVSVTLLMSRSDKLVPSKALDIFIESYTNQSWEIAYEEFEEILHKPIENMLFSFLNTESEAEQDDRTKRLYEENIDLASIYKFTQKRSGGGGISLFAIKNILFDTCLNYWDESEAGPTVINLLSKNLIDRCNQEFKEKGEPLNLLLTAKNNDYEHLRPYAAYYESVSTLGIVLGQPELGDNFFGGNQTRSFVLAAKTVHEAGFTDHAIVLLGYGLVRISSGMIYETDFSAREVNEFITRPEIWPRVEKLFLPFLELCLEFKDGLSYGTQIWIKSIQSRFTKAQLHVLEFDASQVEKLSTEKSFSIPPWFSSDDESLGKAIKDMKNLSDRTSEMNPDTWQRFFSLRDLKGKLTEISQSLEAVTLDKFGPIHQLFISNQKFNQALESLGAKLRAEARMDLGWVEFLIRAIQEAQRKNPVELRKAIEVANESDRTIGKVLFKLQNSEEGLLTSFQHFRKLDNMYLSHKSTKSAKNMPQSESNWLYTYAVSDFKSVADLFK